MVYEAYENPLSAFYLSKVEFAVLKVNIFVFH